jgi:DNA-binding response OmpR family regulator
MPAMSAPQTRTRLLLVEDEAKVAGFIAQGLAEEGYDIDVAASAREAELRLDPLGPEADRSAYDLLIVDWMLPDEDGLVIARRSRARGQTMPILLLTAKDAISDRVTGLEAGADDYLVKPFAFAELVARVRALLRRGQGRVALLRVADVEIDLVARTARRAGQVVTLTAKEFAVLAYLARHFGRPVSRAELLTQVWAVGKDGGISTNLVDAQITRLREKLTVPGSPPLIHTVRGVGYAMAEGPPFPQLLPGPR